MPTPVPVARPVRKAFLPQERRVTRLKSSRRVVYRYTKEVDEEGKEERGGGEEKERGRGLLSILLLPSSQSVNSP